MKQTRLITTVEVHTGGEPFRLVTSGIPRIPGKDILERRKWLGEHGDQYRRALMFEPRGHHDMYGGFLTEPVSEGADFGIIFMQNLNYSPNCGHGVIALSTAAVELGWIERTIPETRVGIDAESGFIEAFVKWDGEHAGEVRFVNVPSFMWMRDVTVQTPSFGPVTGDIAYGGTCYFYVDGAAHGIEVRESNADVIKKLGMEVKAAANAAFDFVHPELPEIVGVYGTIVSGAPRHAGSAQANCCVFADGEVDRSPTGSGTAGRVAQMYSRGELAMGDELVNESIIGSTFKGLVLSETRVGNLEAVVPEIRGSAFIYGFSQWVVDERDPLTYGFQVK